MSHSRKIAKGSPFKTRDIYITAHTRTHTLATMRNIYARSHAYSMAITIAIDCAFKFI